MSDCRRLLIYFFFLSLFIFSDTPAFAHKVTIFAWIEGDTVYTQSKFSGGKRAKGASVIVYDLDENKLLEGKTDDKGRFVFKIPQETALKVVLKASMGHMAAWTIPLEEITAGIQTSDGNSESGIKNYYESSSQSPTITSGSNPAALSEVRGISKQEIKKLIDESLDKKLSPIMNMLADSYRDDPSLTEIIGGTGYIFGLVGVAMYFTSRRKKNYNSGN